MTERSSDIEERIIEGLSQGTPLAVLCREDGMPSDRAVRYWMEQDRDFASAIAHARETGFDVIAMEALAIADETHLDTKKAPDGREVADTEWITRSRLRVETRLKLLAKWDPKRYGDAMLHKHADSEGKNLREMDDTEKLTRLLAILAKAKPDDADSPD